ncbi:MAG TPA: metallopeptidase TldD-related protein [Kofleriaceae bacterium]|nr:metallopeptidase TldD-related protein [Kofleriaceae bacterium]
MTVERLVRLLESARDIDEWIAVESRVRRVARATGPRPAHERSESVSLHAVVLRDSERGRGAATLWLDGEGDDDDHARRLVTRAAERASMALGPAWALPAPAAPARVTVADRDIVADQEGVLDRAMAELRKASRPGAAVGSAHIEVARTWHRAETSRGFISQYEATAATYDLAVGGRALVERVRGRARTGAQMALSRRVADAARRAEKRAAARPLEPGRYDLLLRQAAIAHPRAGLDLPSSAADFGWFAPMVAHASAEWVRLGISRYQPGQPIFAAVADSASAAAQLGVGSLDGAGSGRVARGGPGGSGATTRARAARAHSSGGAAGAGRVGGRPAGEGEGVDAFTLESDGTIDFAPMSAPFGDLGEPVRRFDLVRDGVAAGLALDHREAALARMAPNGGVRNLVLAPGATAAATLGQPGQRHLLDVAELDWIDADPRSGVLTAAIGLAHVRGAPVTGGLVVGNAFDLLGRARLSSEMAMLSWFRGPIAIRIDGVDVV